MQFVLRDNRLLDVKDEKDYAKKINKPTADAMRRHLSSTRHRKLRSVGTRLLNPKYSQRFAVNGDSTLAFKVFCRTTVATAVEN